MSQALPFKTSLIIATYNWPAALDLCLSSILKQVKLPDEVIIADDGSPDNTRQVIEAFRQKISVPVLHIWHPDEGFQLAKIRNKAMAAATGDYLIQIDGDIVLHPSFIYDHVNAARPGYFTGGSRALLDESLSRSMIKNRQISVSLSDNGVRNKFNGLRLPGLAKLIGFFKTEKGLYNLRGCNMAFWKKDMLSINGYNEEIRGWGREDTELVIRLYNKGVKRVYFKLQGIAYHLYHKEFDRERLLENDEILKTTRESNSTWCEKGLNQYI